MNRLDANQNELGYELESELARASLGATERDPNRTLAWVNSVCILFLLIGIFGSRPASVRIKALPPIEEVSAAVVEPLPPAQVKPDQRPQDQNIDQQQADTPRVVVVTPELPSINFSVPTVGNLVVPEAIAQAPSPTPLKRAAPLRSRPIVLTTTGSSGERPQPPYPKIALAQGQQGSVALRMTVDQRGLISTIEVIQSSGFPVLDRGAMDFIKRHWTVPPEKGTRIYEATINYELQRN